MMQSQMKVVLLEIVLNLFQLLISVAFSVVEDFVQIVKVARV
jgi:hypothetical protein